MSQPPHGTPNVRLRAFFFKTDYNTEPVRDWLKELARADRKKIGEDIKTVQFGWPLGMPLNSRRSIRCGNSMSAGIGSRNKSSKGKKSFEIVPDSNHRVPP